jgi:hypothetical protein
MERMAGGQETWAKWKDALLALTSDELREYLRDIEGYGPEQIRACEIDGLNTKPDDWHVTPESKAAMARYDAWRKREADGADGPAVLERQGDRGAALPPKTDERP